MGNQVCCQAASDKYETPSPKGVGILSNTVHGATASGSHSGKEVQSGPVVSAKTASAGGPDAQAADNARAFSTTNPLEVAAHIAPQQGLPYQFHICGPPPPPCDDMRLRTINALKTAGNVSLDPNSIDAPPDPEIASILKLVQSIFEAPAALVALFDDRRIFIRDAEGAFKRGDFPWRWSFCGWTMASKNDQIMVIPDATKDPRFCNNAMVKEGPGVRFYCGTPLLASNGHRIGTLCFADVKPREFDASRCVVLNNLAELVVRHLEKDIALQLRAQDNSSLAAAYGHLRRTLDCFNHCVALLDTGTPGWRVMFVNNACCKALGIDRESLQGSYLSRLLAEVDGTMLPNDANIDAAAVGKEFQVHAKLSTVVVEELVEDGLVKETEQPACDRRFILTFRPASREDLDEGGISIGVPSYIAAAPKKDESDKQLASADGQDNLHRRPERLYFMQLQDAVKLEAEQAAKARAASEANSCSSGLHSRGLSSVMSHDKELSQPPESISGLQMGHLLGKGAYGSVYYGTWYGTPVAVKIIDEELSHGAESLAPPLEALLAKELRHPHIVGTLRCARRVIGPSGSMVALSASAISAGAVKRGCRAGPANNMAGEDSTGAFSDDTARVPSGPGSMRGTGSTSMGTGGSSSSGGDTCVVPKTGASAEAESGWLQGSSFSRRRGAPGSSPLGLSSPFTGSLQCGTSGSSTSTASGARCTPKAAASGPGPLPSGSAGGPTASQAGWAIIQLPSVAGAGRRNRTSMNASVVIDEVVASDAAQDKGDAEAEQRDADRPGSSEDDSEAYDAFDGDCAGRDSNMSPFLLMPGGNNAQSSEVIHSCAGGSAGGRQGSVAGWHGEAAVVRHQTWLVMEHCDRGCLQDAIDRGWLRNGTSLDSSPRMEAVVATAVEIASALSYLHSKDIVHGDLSAWNVMLCTSGSSASTGGRGFVAKVADFGLARHLDIRTNIQTRTYGTLTHMPAETLRDGVVSKAVDVYSLGVLLWQMYTGSRPWAGLRHGQIIVMVVTQGARLRFPPGCLLPSFEELANRCMDPDPSHRPSMESVLAELESMRSEGNF